MPSATNNVPVISPCEKRHFVSVMIPTYNRITHLEKTLQSVLQQDPGPDRMQIMVVDNCSTTEDPAPLVMRIGKGRVQFHRNEKNLGLSGNFNKCVELARGEWVHILHSDDFVNDGFYDEVQAIASSDPNVEAIAFRCNQVREDDSIICDTPDLSGPDSATLARRHFLRPMPVQCPGVVVRRSAYERLGGWTSHFRYVLDVEMWSRVFFNSQTYFSPKVLAAFRIHEGSVSSAQNLVGGECAELYDLIPAMAQNMRLAPDEVKILCKSLHRKTNDHCRIAAAAGNFRNWLGMQKFYFDHLKSPADIINFALRFERNFRCHLFARFRRNRPGSGLS